MAFPQHCPHPDRGCNRAALSSSKPQTLLPEAIVSPGFSVSSLSAIVFNKVLNAKVQFGSFDFAEDRELAKNPAIERGFRIVETWTLVQCRKKRSRRCDDELRKFRNATSCTRTSSRVRAHHTPIVACANRLRQNARCMMRSSVVVFVLRKHERETSSSAIALDQGPIETVLIFASTLSCEGDVVRHAPAPWATASLRTRSANGFGISEEEARCCTVRM
jgi:hypothetical protein